MVTTLLHNANCYGAAPFDFPEMVPGLLYKMTNDIVEQIGPTKHFSLGIRLAPEFLDGPLLYVRQAIEPYGHPHVVFVNASGVTLALSSVILAAAIDNMDICCWLPQQTDTFST